TQRGLRKRDRDLDVNVLPLAGEDRVRPDGHGHEQVARRAAVDARIALPALLDGLAVVDAGRNVDLELALLAHTALPAALAARLADDLARAAADGTRGLRLEHAERRALGLGHRAGAAAVGTGLRTGALGRARAAAFVAGLDAIEGDLLFAAEGRLLK